MTDTSLKDHSTPAVIRYNGFSFGDGNTTPPIYQLSGEPIYDQAGRMVTHVRYVVTISTIVYAEQQNDTASWVKHVREQLSRPGRKLELLELGIGEMTVSPNGTYPDLLWGARPQEIQLTPIGGTLAWQLEWKCEFNVSEPGSAHHANWLALNFTTEYSIDDQGFSTRTIRGYVQIPRGGAGVNGSGTRHSLASVRRRVSIQIPTHFQRQKSTWRESENKTRLDFEVVDRQLRSGAYPPGVVDGEVKYHIENDGADFTFTKASLSGWLESAPNASKSAALLQLLAIAYDRANRLAASPGQPWVVPTGIRISQDLFGRRAQLTCEYRTASCITNLIAASGIWAPVPGADYRRWKASVEELWQNGGSANLQTHDGDDLIIDLVDNPINQAEIGKTTSGSQSAPSGLSNLPIRFFAPPQKAWLKYHITLNAHRQENASRHVLARRVTSGSPTSGNGLGTPYQSAGAGPGIVHEVHGEPNQQMVLEGEAIRLGSRPHAPVLISVGGRSLFERKRSEKLEQYGVYCGTPAYRLKWSITYDVCGYVDSITPPAGGAEGSKASQLSL